MYVIPFGSDDLKKIITGEIDSPTIDYVNSKIKGKNFITYFSNLKYKNITIDFSSVTKEELFELVKEFIKHQSTVHIEQFEATILKALFYYKGYDLSLVDESPLDKVYFTKCILSNEEVIEFVDQNKDLVRELIDVLDGTLLYAIKNLNAYKEEVGDKVTDNVVVDKVQVGKTFVNYFDNETFNSYYYSTLPAFEDMKYFEYYYDRPIYSGQLLINYISKDCVLFPLLKMILDQEYTPEQLEQLYKETYVTSV